MHSNKLDPEIAHNILYAKNGSETACSKHIKRNNRWCRNMQEKPLCKGKCKIEKSELTWGIFGIMWIHCIGWNLLILTTGTKSVNNRSSGNHLYIKYRFNGRKSNNRKKVGHISMINLQLLAKHFESSLKLEVKYQFTMSTGNIIYANEMMDENTE